MGLKQGDLERRIWALVHLTQAPQDPPPCPPHAQTYAPRPRTLAPPMPPSNRPNKEEEEQRHNRAAAGRGKAEQQGPQGKHEAERTAAGRQSEAGTAAAEQTVAAAWQVGEAAGKEGTGQERRPRRLGRRRQER